MYPPVFPPNDAGTVMTMRSILQSPLFGGVLVAVLLTCMPLLADAQVIRAPNTWYGRAGLGASVSETDISTYAVEPWSLNAEVGYQWSNRFGSGIGVVHANYPKVWVEPLRLTTVQAGTRMLMYPKADLTPYFNMGAHATFGGVNFGGGPYFGLGLDYVVSQRMSVFVDATAYATFPDDGIDGMRDGRAAFDGLGFWGMGVRATLRPAPTPIDLGPVEAPATTFRSNETVFSITPTNEATKPIKYTWHMGDGTTYTGKQTVSHTYRIEGDYSVRVDAQNDAGTTTKRHTITVNEPETPARVLALHADTLQVSTYEMVRLYGAYEGTSPLDVTWDFGDGQQPALERGIHTYDADRFIGASNVQTTQGYVFNTPGTYTVTLNASNAFGSDAKTVTIEVNEGRLMRASLPGDPCDSWSLPDRLFFAFDSAHLAPRTQQVLTDQLPTLRSCPDHMIRLDGFADFVGPDAYNESLSLRRAEAIKQFFVAQGIDSARFLIQGHGRITDACPPSERDAGCQRDRRVESTLLLREPQMATARTEPVSVVQSVRDDDAPDAAASPTGAWTVVVASEENEADAKKAQAHYAEALPDVTLHLLNDSTERTQNRYRVGVGTFTSVDDARTMLTTLSDRVPQDAWLLRLP